MQTCEVTFQEVTKPINLGFISFSKPEFRSMYSCSLSLKTDYLILLPLASLEPDVIEQSRVFQSFPTLQFVT